MSLEALRNVLRNNDGTEIQCVGHFKLLFMLVRLGASPLIQSLTLEILISATANKNCVTDIANAEVLINLLLVLHSFVAGKRKNSERYGAYGRSFVFVEYICERKFAKYTSKDS